MSIQIGISGWSYEHWRGVLYPLEAPARERLSYYTREFGTVEREQQLLPLAKNGIINSCNPMLTGLMRHQPCFR